MTDEIRLKGYQSPNIGKRGKSKKTLEKEELRKKFTEYFGERFLILLTQLEIAVKKGNMVATLEILRQLIGSADNKLDITSGGKPIPLLQGIIKENDTNQSPDKTPAVEETD